MWDRDNGGLDLVVAVVNGEEEFEFWVYFEIVGDDGLNLGWERGVKNDTKTRATKN